MKTETVPPFQETPAGSSCHLNNLLSSRKLMAVGVLLGWLLVIHLLVNVWLLCLLSALLVVLGGWLGSSLAGVASGRLHLERFIPLATCPPCPEAERQLEREINRTIQMIIRDFVLSWYRSVSQEPAFEEEMEAAMKGLVQELRRRMSVMDSHAVAQSVLTLCGCHLQSYIQAKEATAGKNGPVEPSHLWEAYCRATAPHPAVHSPSAEVTYTRGVVNLLLQGLVPKPHLETRTGRHVVVELITCNVILPLISRLSDPDWIHLVLYETALDGENSSGLQQLAYHTVNRRYREFLNLQTRLEEKPDLRKFIKNVKGPKKLFPDLPLGNMDSDRVEARKSLLESFLKQLCAIPEIANSEEVQEFLALNTDARIAFVKKPFMVSRIDKMVVSAIVDTLKTAFPRSEPQSPTEELSEAETESKPQTEGKKASKSRLRFSSSKISPALSVTEAQDKILYCLQEGNVESETLSMSAMESFIEKQTKLLEMQPTKAPEKDPEQPPKGRVDSCVSDAAVPAQDPSNSDPGTETELADTALDLLLLLLTEQWKWLCTENMQKFLRLIFGTLVQRVQRPSTTWASQYEAPPSLPSLEASPAVVLSPPLSFHMESKNLDFEVRSEIRSCFEGDKKPTKLLLHGVGTGILSMGTRWRCRWLEVQVANLTSPQRWVQYLLLLQESIWPGGVLPKFPRPVRTQEQKLAAEKQALQSLMGVLPDLVVEILGVNKCRLSWGLVLESLQQPLINRHLIYCLGDIILEFLDLSASVEESAATTSASDTPGNSKRMGVSS
eukprot:XP_011541126.1 sorting nexin-19 isoform X4 [Homo sapiens]